jgi:hypothetical protein
MVSLRVIGLSLLLGATQVGCGHSATGPAGLPTQGCEDAARAAANAQPSSGRTEQLDPVLRACTSVQDLEAAASEYPVLFPGSDTQAVARARCKEPGGPAGVPICIALMATAGPS